MRPRIALLLFPFACVIGACAEPPLAPEAITRDDGHALLAKGADGSGLELSSVTGLTVPLLNVNLGDVVIDQVIIKEFGIVEDVAGNIIGLDATGTLQLSGEALGTEAVTQDFTTRVAVVSSGNGRCDVVTIDLAPVRLDALGGLAAVDVPAAEVTPRASGALGSVLCAVGQLANPLVGGITRGIRGLINALNNLIP